MVPWDTSKSPKLDVLLHAKSLCELARSGRVCFSWIATPCKSLTGARKPVLRSLGLPLGKLGLRDHQQVLVNLGNALAFFCVEFILELMKVSAYWALENPHRSFLWLLPVIMMLWNVGGVGRCLASQCVNSCLAL